MSYLRTSPVIRRLAVKVAVTAMSNAFYEDNSNDDNMLGLLRYARFATTKFGDFDFGLLQSPSGQR